MPSLTLVPPRWLPPPVLLRGAEGNRPGAAAGGQGGPPGGGFSTGGPAGAWPPPGRGGGPRGPARPPRRLALIFGALLALVAVLAVAIVSSLDRAATGDARPSVPLVGAAAPAIQVLAEGARIEPPPSAASNRFDGGWEPRTVEGRAAWVPAPGGARLSVVNLGEEVPRTLVLDLAKDGLPEGERLSVRSGDREVARATLSAASLPLRVGLPEDLPVGQTPLDLIFGDTPPAAAGPSPGAAPAPPAGAAPRGAGAAPPVAPPGAAVPAVFGASWGPVATAGEARAVGHDIVEGGNCLVYIACRLSGNEALVGTFEPPAEPRPGQRFDLSVERLDGTPIRRFGWRPSFWNRLRGARRFELPLRGAQGAARVRLIARAGDAGGPPGRWRGLGLASVNGVILSPGQGQ